MDNNKYICNICNQKFTDQLSFAQHCVGCYKKHEEEILKVKQVKDEERIKTLYNELNEAIDNYFALYPDTCLRIKTEGNTIKVITSRSVEPLILL